ncbi:MAG: hypothetical protein CSA49_05750 [Gammaproteobacteria bacterium]|nr:MAG: hypothetical protein CSA49_05750 [Gammaproteobacteria bacterium]
MQVEIDLHLIPTTLDAVHIGLGALALLLLVILLTVFRNCGAEKNQKASTPAPRPVESLKEAKPDAALQLLGLFQQEARLVDFLNENLTGFSDADIGATARVIHEGGKKVLNEYFELAPVRSEDEETQVTLPEGFNAAEVRLTGNVVGQAPFTGVLVHKGWKVTTTKLPKLAPDHDAAIIAPAEVEL